MSKTPPNPESKNSRKKAAKEEARRRLRLFPIIHEVRRQLMVATSSRFIVPFEPVGEVESYGSLVLDYQGRKVHLIVKGESTL